MTYLKTEMKRYLLYIFDLDGTLINSLHGLTVCYKRALDSLSLKYDPDDVINFTKEPLYVTYSRFQNPGVSFKKFEETVFREYRTSLNPNSIPYPDTRYALQRIADEGLPMCIATKSTCDRTQEVLEIHDLLKYFDQIIGHESVERQKPHPDCLEHCASSYNIEKKDMVFIGDSDTDMFAAHAFGIDCVFIDRDGKAGCEFECTYKISSLRELF